MTRVTKMEMGKVRHTWIALRDLKIHPAIQREFREHYAHHLAATFDPDSFGELRVIENHKGFWVWDGQHRVAAAKEYLGGDEQQVPCEITVDAEIEELAKRSLNHSNPKHWTPVDRFRLRLLAKDWTALTINQILTQYKLAMRHKGPGRVQAVHACDWVMQKCGRLVFEKTVAILHQAYGLDERAYHNLLIRGLAMVCERNEKVNVTQMAGKLKKFGPAEILGKVNDKADIDLLPKGEAACQMFVLIYNRGRRGGQLTFAANRKAKN